MTSARAGRYHIEIDRGTCVQCAGCVSICPTRALDMLALDLYCDDPMCIGCDLCVRFCPVVSLSLHEVTARTPEPAQSPRSSDSCVSPV